MSAVVAGFPLPTLCPSRISMGKEIRWRRNFLLSLATGALRRMGGVAVIRCAARCRSHGQGCPATISTPTSIGNAGPVTQITRQRAFLSPSCTPMTSPTRSFASSPESRAPRSLISRMWAFREKGRPSASMPNTRTTRSAMKRGSSWSDMQWRRARHFGGSLALEPGYHAARALPRLHFGFGYMVLLNDEPTPNITFADGPLIMGLPD
jgi:hypothetical protein